MSTLQAKRHHCGMLVLYCNRLSNFVTGSTSSSVSCGSIFEHYLLMSKFFGLYECSFLINTAHFVCKLVQLVSMPNRLQDWVLQYRHDSIPTNLKCTRYLLSSVAIRIGCAGSELSRAHNDGRLAHGINEPIFVSSIMITSVSDRCFASLYLKFTRQFRRGIK